MALRPIPFPQHLSVPPLPDALGLLPGGLDGEIRENPYWFRMIQRPGSPLKRRFASLAPVAAGGALLLLLSTLGMPREGRAFLWIEAYVAFRIFLLYRPARLAVLAAREDLAAGNLVHLALSPMSGRDLTLGWALSGWSRAAPESLALFLLLSPLLLASGPVGVVLGGIELIHLLLLQGLSALVASGLMAGFHHRHEAATAGWVSALLTFPLVFILQTLVMGLILAVLPLAILLLLGSSMPAHWPELDSSTIGFSALVLLGSTYAVWIPVATLKEFARQLDLAGKNAPPGFQHYLQNGNH